MAEFLKKFISTWWGITLFVIICIGVLILMSAVLYKQFFKRFYDILLSGIALIVLSPVLLVLTIVGAIKMKGNPFFTQLRPGKINKKTGKEKIFKLIKFRSMTCEKDENGNLLPDEKRLTKYGKILRSTSLDELPELINILIGNMSIVGPRPLLVEYLPYYTEEERTRHSIRPGLTGYSQVSGRNFLSWDKRLDKDVEYVRNISLWGDVKIMFKTAFQILNHKDVVVDSRQVEPNFAQERAEKINGKK